MAALLSIVTFAAALRAGTGALLRARDTEDSDCNRVVFDRTDMELHVRTMVVEDSTRQRHLVLTAENDTSMPCRPRWWLDHNPQGMVECLGNASGSLDMKAPKEQACDAAQCKVNADNIPLGYVRTMLASAVFVPQPHTMSAICIELGCRSRITHTHVGTLLETAREVQWASRPRLQRVLIIGLGSSTMASWMRQQLPDTELHVAELVPAVAAAAPCFGLDSGHDKGLHLHVGDGRSVLQNIPDGHFDAILVDAFDHDAALPPCFRTSEFFALARRKLLPGGALSFNLFADGSAKERIVKALTGSFDVGRIWVGNAPGAEGIQEVLTAFASGRPATRSGAASPGGESARRWFGAAKYRLLRAQQLQDVKAFEDAAECPGKPHQHG